MSNIYSGFLSLNMHWLSAPIALWAARRHVALLRFGRPVFESRLADLSWSRPPSLSPTLFPVFLLSYEIKGKNAKKKKKPKNALALQT